MTETVVYGWHFLREDRRTLNGDEPPWTDGEERTWAGPLKMCESGYHACCDLLDALTHYCYGPLLCRVELGGEIIHDGDKSVGRRRKR